VLEARRAGLPVICTPVGGLPDLVRDGVSGLHVPRGDAGTLADTMAASADDPELWQRLAGHLPGARTIDACATDHLALFRNLVALGATA